MIKKIIGFTLLIALITIITACNNNQASSLKVVLLTDKLIPQLENKLVSLTYLEGQLSTEIQNNQDDQFNDFEEEPIHQEQETPSKDLNDEEKGDPQPPHITTQTGVFMEEMEEEVILLVNQLRQQLGVAPLKMSQELRETARAKSKDMFEYDYFDHQGHLTFSQLLSQAEVRATITGENIYRSQSPLTTAKLIFEAWKSSPTHYENMIHDQFHFIGVGIYHVNENGIDTYFATQHVID